MIIWNLFLLNFIALICSQLHQSAFNAFPFIFHPSPFPSFSPPPPSFPPMTAQVTKEANMQSCPKKEFNSTENYSLYDPYFYNQNCTKCNSQTPIQDTPFPFNDFYNIHNPHDFDSDYDYDDYSDLYNYHDYYKRKNSIRKQKPKSQKTRNQERTKRSKPIKTKSQKMLKGYQKINNDIDEQDEKKFSSFSSPPSFPSSTDHLNQVYSRNGYIGLHSQENPKEEKSKRKQPFIDSSKFKSILNGFLNYIRKNEKSKNDHSALEMENSTLKKILKFEKEQIRHEAMEYRENKKALAMILQEKLERINQMEYDLIDIEEHAQEQEQEKLEISRQRKDQDKRQSNAQERNLEWEERGSFQIA